MFLVRWCAVITTQRVLHSGVVTLTWAVTETGSGVPSCNVDVSVGGGAFARWLSNVTQTSAVYTGTRGIVYAFRVTAVDRANNSGSAEATALAETVTKYYAAGGRRVAMRENGVVYYLHGDHLGSTSLVTCGSEGGCNGTPYRGVVSRQWYHPYGSVRASEGTLPTDVTYTGQRDVAGINLLFYRARFYSSSLGRFVSADTLVPSAGNPADLNRYAYARNNPLKYIDPTGHDCVWANGKMVCSVSVTTAGTGGSNTLTVNVVAEPASACYAPDTPSDDPLDVKLARVLMWGLGAVNTFGGTSLAAQNPSISAGPVPFLPGTELGGPGSPNNLVAASMKASSSKDALDYSAAKASATPLKITMGTGSLPSDVAKQIQALVDEVGAPINVVGGYARGDPHPRKDIDYYIEKPYRESWTWELKSKLPCPQCFQPMNDEISYMMGWSPYPPGLRTPFIQFTPNKPPVWVRPE